MGVGCCVSVMVQIIPAFMADRPGKLVVGGVLVMNVYLSTPTHPAALMYLQVDAV
jgi:hypothetical protein